MVEQILLFNDYWELVAESTDETVFWRHKGTGATFTFSPTPGEDDDIARLQDVGSGGGGGAGALSELTIDTDKNWEGYDLGNVGTVEPTDVRYTEGHGPLPFPAQHTNYDAGLDTREIVRVTCDSDERLAVYRLETKLLGGGTDPDFTVDIYDATSSEVLASTSDKVKADGSALATSGTGATVLLRVTNQTGASKRASITGLAAFIGA